MKVFLITEWELLARCTYVNKNSHNLQGLHLCAWLSALGNKVELRRRMHNIQMSGTYNCIALPPFVINCSNCCTRIADARKVIRASSMSHSIGCWSYAWLIVQRENEGKWEFLWSILLVASATRLARRNSEDYRAIWTSDGTLMKSALSAEVFWNLTAWTLWNDEGKKVLSSSRK